MIRPSSLQTSYQRNYLKSMAIASLLSCFLAIVIKLTDHYSSNIRDSISIISDTCIVYNDNSGFGYGLKESFESTRRIRQNIDRQFAGFVNIKPIPDMTVSGIEIKHQGKDKIFMHELASLPDDNIQDLNLSDAGPGTNVSYPGNYWDNDFGYGPGIKNPGTEDINCPLEVIKKQLPEFPGIARIDEKEGYVEVLVHIDINGRVTPFSCKVKDSTEDKLEFFVDDEQNNLVFVIFKEDPKGYYFAKNLVEVLPGWVFKPQIEHGVPVDVFVRVKLRYCFSNNEDCRNQQVEFEVL